MTSISVRSLVATTITNPAEAARWLLGLNLTRETLWLAMALAVVLNAFLHVLSSFLFPLTDPDLQAIAGSLVFYVVVVVGSLLLSIGAFYLVGQKMGGVGSFNDLMTLMVWLQYLRVLVQAAALILTIVAPNLLPFLAIPMFLLGLFITVHFIDQAHRFGSPLKAFGVLVLSAIALAVAFTVLLSLIGGPMMGVPANV